MSPATGGGWDTGKIPLEICPDPAAHALPARETTLDEAALAKDLETQWLAAHADHCDNLWPHPDHDCYWPQPASLAAALGRSGRGLEPRELDRLEALARAAETLRLGRDMVTWIRESNVPEAYFMALTPDVVLRLIAALSSPETTPAGVLDEAGLAKALCANREPGIEVTDDMFVDDECRGLARAIAADYAAALGRSE